MIFHVEVKEVGTDERNNKAIIAPYVVFDGTTTIAADDALARTQPGGVRPEGEAMQEAKAFLFEILAAGPVLKSTIEEEAEGRDITAATLRRARLAIKVEYFKKSQKDGHGPWMWQLPEQPDPLAVALEFQEAPATVPDDPRVELM